MTHAKRTIEEMMAELDEMRRLEALVGEVIRLDRQTPPADGTVPQYLFFSHCRTRIAVVQDLGDAGLAMYRFDRFGPSGHTSPSRLNPDNVGNELWQDGFEPVICPEAGETLEAWARGDDWANGLERMLWLTVWQALYDGGHAETYEASHQMHKFESRRESIRFGVEVCRKFELSWFR